MNYNNPHTEAQLVDGILRKNNMAFSYLYDHYAGALLKCITRIVRDKNITTDVLQNVFIKIYLNIPSYDPGKGRLLTWMLHITRHECIDTLRSKAYAQSIQKLELETHLHQVGINPYKNIDVRNVRKIVFSLPPEFRMLIELSYYYGFSHREIALLVHMPVGTVKTKISKAYQSLRQEIEKE